VAKMEIKRCCTKTSKTITTCVTSRSDVPVYPSALREYYDELEIARQTLKNKYQEINDMDEVLFDGLNAEKARYFREFLSQDSNSTGFYYPWYEVTGNLEHGSPHVSYLCRPYLNYRIKWSNKKFGRRTQKQGF